MTKAEEIQILQAAAKKLGPSSYCGPWLESVIGEVENEIRCDFMPSPSIIQTARDCETMMEDGRRKAAYIVDAAAKEAEKIRQDARRYRDDVQATAKRLLLVQAARL